MSSHCDLVLRESITAACRQINRDVFALRLHLVLSTLITSLEWSTLLASKYVQARVLTGRSTNFVGSCELDMQACTKCSADEDIVQK